ncbi:MAG: hypothetical protein GY806_18765 [Gammaproteobacteria bacterium]|nr:hypothetical protein [Gammaproteobacteria bacterium]
MGDKTTHNKDITEITEITDISDFTAALRQLSQYSKLSVGMRHESMFLGAWIIGVDEVGIKYFRAPVNTRIHDIKSINSLRPNLKKISQYITELEEHKAALLLAMCDFYSPGFSIPYLAQIHTDSIATLALNLDPIGRQIVSTLLENYTGWQKRYRVS